MIDLYAMETEAFSCLVALDRGTLVDILFETHANAPKIGEIYRGRVARPVKGMGGVFIDGNGTQFFLRTKKPPAAGHDILVQVKSIGEDGKAPLVSDKIELHSPHLVLTPMHSGLSLSKQITSLDERARLEAVFATHPARDTGLILRSNAVDIDTDQLRKEADSLIGVWKTIESKNELGRVHALPPFHQRAETRFGEVNVHNVDALPDQVAETVAQALQFPLQLKKGTLFIESTRAYIAVDINTSGETGVTAGLEANLDAMSALPLALKLRGLGGQIIIDLAPMQQTRRKTLLNRLNKTIKDARFDMRFVGWTPLGNMECLVTRNREPLPQNFLALTTP